MFNPATLDAMRGRLADYLTAATGADLRGTGGRLVCLCPNPSHQDNRPSFAVFGARLDRAGCFPCGWQGDVFSLSQWLGRSSTFPEAVADVAAVLGVILPETTGRPATGSTGAGMTRRAPAPRPARRDPPPIILPKLDVDPAAWEEAKRAARWNLYRECKGHTAIARTVAAEMGTSVEILRGLTFTTDAVGIEYPCDRNGRPVILYLYEHGAKVRHPAGRKPRFEWLHGKAALPWRWHFAARTEVLTVHVTEGETDAIAAIGAGLECLHPKTGRGASAVVACPGTAFPAAWAPLFRRKRVVILPDRDTPGEQAARRTAEILSPYALSVAVADWRTIDPPTTTKEK